MSRIIPAHIQGSSPIWRLAVFITFIAIAAVSTSYAGKVQYTYDAAGRLVSADYGSTAVTTFTYDPNGNLLQRATSMPTSADVRLTKVASVTAASAGLPFTYTLTATNAGPDAASDVVVTDELPFGILLNALGVASQGSVSLSNRTVIGNLGVLAAGQSATLSLSVFHGITNPATNVAMVTSTTPDPNTANNTAMDSTFGLTPPDSDGDGMPNWWETLNGPSPFSSSGNNGANGDFDGDGVRNFDEWLADTRANDPTSFFAIDSFLLEPGGPASVSVSFDSSAIRRYEGQVAGALNPPALTGFETNNGTGLPMSMTHTNAADTNQFYGVEAQLP